MYKCPLTQHRSERSSIIAQDMFANMLGRVILHVMALTAIVINAKRDYCNEDSYGRETSDKVSRLFVVNLFEDDYDVVVPSDACQKLSNEGHVMGVKASGCGRRPWTLKITNLTTIHVHRHYYDLISLNVTLSCLVEPKAGQFEASETTKKNPYNIGRRSVTKTNKNNFEDVTSEYDVTVEDVIVEDATVEKVDSKDKPSKKNVAIVTVKKSKHGKSKKSSKKVKFVNLNADKNERRKRSAELDSSLSSISSSSSEEVGYKTNSQQHVFPKNATNVN